MPRSRRSNTSRAESVSSGTSYTYYNKTFDDITDLFLFACAHGDYMLVYRLLQAGEVKADVSNRMGKTALQLAIESEHFEIVQILLDTIPYEQFRDALLLAIYLGFIKIADFIMNHQTYRTFSGGFLDPTHPQAYDDSQFSSDITPLILAAQFNRLQIVHQLLSKGNRIKTPHSGICSCVDCTDSLASDSFRHAQIRLSAYKGLSSDVYIALAYPDPILQAFELRAEIRSLAKVEHHFYEEYNKLAHQLSIFVARLLDNVRGYEELEIVLNKTGLPHQEKYENLARFDLAIQYREIPFVSHSNCQQKLIEKWYENLSVIKNVHLMQRTLFYIGFIICFPFLSLTYYISPKSKIGSLCQQPNLKFKAYIAFYVIFISLIIASSTFSTYHLQTTQFLSTLDSSIYTNYIQLIYQNTALKNGIINNNVNNTTIDSFVNCDIGLRFMEPNPFQIAIFIWVVGFVWNEFKQIVSSGFRVYLKAPSNYVDCSMNILYVLYFVFLYSSMICTRISLNTFYSSDYWFRIAQYETMSDMEKQYYIIKTRHILYWLNADRFYWQSMDLQNIAEAFFAMGNVVSICRTCFLLPTIAFVGPLQVLLERMIIDISKWISIILIIFIAFACSLFFIFSYFAAVVQQQNALLQLSNDGISSSSTLAMANTSTTALNMQCPDYFYDLLNQSIPLVLDSGDDGTDNTDDGSFCEQSSSYSTIKNIGPYPGIYYFGQSFTSTLKTTFFTLFGVIGENGIPDRGYELVTLSCFKPDPNTYISGFDDFTANLGFVIYGIFTFACVTVLINTLIAMLEESTWQIGERADIEWKFARSKLYMEYIRDGNILPVPLNIFPSPKSIINLLNQIKRMICSKQSSSNNGDEKSDESKVGRSTYVNIRRDDDNGIDLDKFKNEKIFNRKRSHVASDNLTYKIVIERIVKRFLLYYKNSHHGFDEEKDRMEFKEIKNDISSFRFELSHEMDMLGEAQTSVKQSMTKLNDNLQEHFDFERIKHHLNNQKLS